MSQPNPGRSYGIQEWCALRGISRTTAYRLIRDGELTTFKIRKNRFVSAAADREFIARMEEEAA